MTSREDFTDCVLFYLLAVATSWILWAPLVAYRLGIGPAVPSELHLIGSLGPALAGLLFIHRRGGLTGGFWRRLVWPEAALIWLALAIALPLMIGLGGILGQRLVEENWPNLVLALTSKEFPTYSAAAIIATELIFYGFGEELGWRGFLLPVLLRHMSALAASVVITLPWAMWHLPLILSNDTYQSLGAIGLVGWVVSLLTGSVLLTWMFVRSVGSLLVVAVFHAAIDIVMVNPAVDMLGVNIMGALITVAGILAAGDLYRKREAARRLAL